MANGKQIPSWIYVLGVMVSVLGINGVFAGWYSNALDKVGNTVASELVEMKGDFTHDFGRMQTQINKRFENLDRDVEKKLLHFQSLQDQQVQRFWAAAEANGRKLDLIAENQGDLKVKVKEIRTIQKMVENKLDLGHP